MRPNPFNPAVTINIGSLTTELPIEVTISNVLGQQVGFYRLHPNRETTQFLWRGKDDSDWDVAAGVYLIHITQGARAVTKRVHLLR